MSQHGHKCYPCPATCGTSEPEKCRIVIAFNQIKSIKDSTNKPEWVDMPNGYGLFWKENGVGGRTYISDEIGGGVTVWDTSLVSEETLLLAVEVERKIVEKEKIQKIKSKLEKFINEQKDIPQEFVQILNEEFWELI